MPVGTYGYTPNHKVWDHVGNIVPGIEHSPGIRPSLEVQVAEWLPTLFYEKHFENWYVISAGKLVAADPDGRLMPAEYGLTSASVTYTQNDVDAGVIDVATGLPVTTTKTVVLNLLTGVRHASWTRDTAGVGVITSGFMGREGVAFDDANAKYPIGVAAMPMIQAAGGDGFNPTAYNKHNYNMQHAVTVLCDAVLRLPLVPAKVASETVDTTTAGSALVFGTQATHTRAEAAANATGRYNATYGEVPVLGSYPVIALALDNYPVAKNTIRTTLALASDNANDDVSSILVNEKGSLAAVAQAGDFWVDYDFGVIFIYSSDGSTVPAVLTGAAGNITLAYYHLASAPSTVSKFASVLAGSLKVGDFLKCGANSNFVVATTEDFKDIVGQVVGFETWPRGALDKVRTAFSPAISTDASGGMANGSASSASVNAGQLDQLPGSANGGVPTSIHYAGAANQIVLVNLVSR